MLAWPPTACGAADGQRHGPRPGASPPPILVTNRRELASEDGEHARLG